MHHVRWTVLVAVLGCGGQQGASTATTVTPPRATQTVGVAKGHPLVREDFGFSITMPGAPVEGDGPAMHTFVVEIGSVRYGVAVTPPMTREDALEAATNAVMASMTTEGQPPPVIESIEYRGRPGRSFKVVTGATLTGAGRMHWAPSGRLIGVVAFSEAGLVTAEVEAFMDSLRFVP